MPEKKKKTYARVCFSLLTSLHKARKTLTFLMPLPMLEKYVPTIIEAYWNVSEAHVGFSTTQQLFSSSSHPRKQTCLFRKNFIISKWNMQFLPQ